jgi:phage terminase small subunit
MPRKITSVRPKAPADLTAKQIAFAIAYAGCGVATQAARVAGYSPKTAAAQGCMLLKHPGVAALIDGERVARWQRLQMAGDEVLARAAVLARSNVKRMFEVDGRVKNPADLDEFDAYCVASVEAQLVFGADGAPPEEIRKIKMRDPMPALRLLAQHHKLVGAEVEVNIAAGLAQRLAAARRRARAEST